MRSTPISKRRWAPDLSGLNVSGRFTRCQSHWRNRLMKRHAIAALAASLLILPSLALAESRTIEVGSFHGVDVSSGIRAIVTAGKPQSVVAETTNQRDLDDL